MSFAAIADQLGGAPKKSGFGSIADDLAPNVPASAPKPSEQEAQFQTNDPVKMRAAILKSGDTGLLQAFDRNFPQPKPQPVAQPAQPLPTQPQGYAAVPMGPGESRPVTQPEPPKTWWDRLAGPVEAAASLATGATTGFAGGIAGAVHDMATGGEPSTGFQRGMTAMTYQPRTQTGKELVEKTVDAINRSGIAGVAPLTEFQALPEAAGNAAQAVRDSFSAKVGAPAPAARVEPAFEKPRYVQVDGQWQIKNPEMPGGTPETAAAVKPSLATASPELVQAVKTAEKKGGPAPADILQRHVEADSLPVPVRLTAGQAALDQQAISQEMNNRGKFPELNQLYNEQGKKLAQNIDAIKESAAPNAGAANHVEAGQQLVDAYKSMDAPIKADISAKYKAFFDAAGGDIPLNGDGLVSSIDKALSRQMKGRYLPSAVRGDLDAIRGGEPLTFENFENLRTNLAAEARKAQRTGDGNALGAINIARSELESLPMEGEAAALKPLADAARKAAAERFAKIKADPAYAAAIADNAKVGDLSPLSDSFVQQYVVKGKSANVQRMSENLSGDPLARETAAAGAIDYLKSRAGADPESGLFSQSGYNKAWKELSGKQAFLFDPQTSQYLDTLGKVAKYTQVQPRGSFVNNSNTFVAGLASKAATAAEKAGNVAVPGLGLGTDIREALAKRSAQKAVDSHTAPGAGLTKIRDFPK